MKKFIEHRDFNVSWANNDAEEWMNHREKYGKEFLIPMAVSSNILYEPDNEGNVSFTEKFIDHMAEASKNRKAITDPKLEKSHVFVEYYTTIEVSKYLGLTYEQFYELPSSGKVVSYFFYQEYDQIFEKIVILDPDNGSIYTWFISRK